MKSILTCITVFITLITAIIGLITAMLGLVSSPAVKPSNGTNQTVIVVEQCNNCNFNK